MTGQELVGKKLNDYYIEGVLGVGSLTVIYRALDKQDNVVALKVLFLPPGESAEIFARFQREAETASRLDHPNIVKVLDVGQANGLAYLVMPFIKGETLAERLQQKGRLKAADAIDIAWQIANALDYAHLQGVIHRDVKPSNVILKNRDHAMLSDFGVAQAADTPALTQAGHIIGTPAYMAPEQAMESFSVDGRADLYSLGVMLYRMVTGKLPFSGTTAQMLHAQAYDRPPSPSSIIKIPPTLEAIILRALAKSPEDRYQSGADMARTLSMLAHQLNGQTEKPAPVFTKVRGWLSRFMILD